MVQAYFSNIKNIILNEIHNSKKDISIAVAWFTQQDLFNAIIEALERGVSISIILINDIINRNKHGLDFSLYLQKGGKLCFADSRKTLMHNKLLKTVDIRSPKTVISVHFSYSLPMAMQIY